MKDINLLLQLSKDGGLSVGPEITPQIAAYEWGDINRCLVKLHRARDETERKCYRAEFRLALADLLMQLRFLNKIAGDDEDWVGIMELAEDHLLDTIEDVKANRRWNA